MSIFKGEAHPWRNMVTWCHPKDQKTPEMKATSFPAMSDDTAGHQMVPMGISGWDREQDKKEEDKNNQPNTNPTKGRGLGKWLSWWSACRAGMKAWVWISSTYIKKPGAAVILCNPNTEGSWDRGISRSCWSARLAKLESSNFRHRPSLKKIRYRVTKEDTKLDPHMYEHTCTCILVYTGAHEHT